MTDGFARHGSNTVGSKFSGKKGTQQTQAGQVEVGGHHGWGDGGGKDEVRDHWCVFLPRTNSPFFW